MPTINKQLAEAIADKLKAKFKQKKRHDFACIYHNNKYITSFGISRGSNKDSGHNHVIRQLFISTQQTVDLALCPMSRDDWIKLMKEKGKI